jgi:hypothetical protein
MFLGLPDAHPDPLDRGTDTRIQICFRIGTKMSRIRSTDANTSRMHAKGLFYIFTFVLYTFFSDV